ncbi:hypothetical protein [Xanthomonas hortorum]|uniref:hypothetical protein n=2 Tax=Xanthomonas hortorum TaxID=56454 RepID=UPI001F325C3F|nr:hypothetical protein [Xanthomonas hortorum]
MAFSTFPSCQFMAGATAGRVAAAGGAETADGVDLSQAVSAASKAESAMSVGDGERNDSAMGSLCLTEVG